VKSFVIAVTDVNDNAPATIRLNGQTSLDVAESMRVGDLVGTLTATDADGSPIVSYAMEANAFFEIVTNAETGAFEVRLKAGVDYETAAQRAHVLRITASDGVNTSAPQDITINVTNVNEAPTSLLLSNTIVYESGFAIQIGTLSVADADGDTLRFDLVDANGNVTDDTPFEILTVSATGEVRLVTKTGIHVETDEIHAVRIKVSDGKGGSLIRDFDITIKNVNVAPTNLTLSNTIVNESSTAVRVGTLNATDTDGDELTYILVDANGTEVTDTSPFEIQEIRANGVKVHRLATKTGIQVDADETRDVWIRVSDSKGSVAQKFTITIRDVADTAVNKAPTLFIATDAATVRASDLDGPITPFMGVSFDDAEDDVLSLSISFDPVGGDLKLTPETWATSVAIDPETGAKTYTFAGRKAELAALMDRLSFDPVQQPGNSGAIKTVFKISVKDALHEVVSDSSVSVVTTITNKNHAPEGVGLGGSLVSENAGAGTLVGTLSAQDRDAGDTLVYTLADDRFYIDGNQLRVKDGAKLDFEAAQSRQITIQVSDGVTSVDQTYTISIGDMVETLTGTKGKDLLRGGAGSDVIKGGYSNDTLLGDGGQDFFVFNTKLGTSKTDRKVNIDTIKDFKVVDDSIWLDDKIFKNPALKKLGKGASEANPKQLTSKFFKIGDKAKDKNDYIVYNKKTGVLSYDADGSGFKYKAVEFAKIGKNLALTSKDFFII
jgi:Ca2+-binding RTX toxin-like protein